MRYFTSDFHFGSAVLLDKNAMGPKARSFASLDDMHAAIVKACGRLKPEDTLFHLGDFACVGNDRGYAGLDCRKTAVDFLNGIKCNKVLIAGNHDENNVGLTTADFAIIRLGKWTVSVQHYPSTDERAKLPTLMKTRFQINLCGHVHKWWKAMYDRQNAVLNINVGLDMNGFELYSEPELVNLIQRAVDWVKSGSRESFAKYEAALAHKKAAQSREQKLKSYTWLRDNKPELLTPEKRKWLEENEGK